MNKTQLITTVAERLQKNDSDLSRKDVADVLTVFEQTVFETCAAGEPVMISGFVKFARVDRKARQGRNPMTGETIQIAAKSVAKATALKGFKDAVLAGPPKKAKKDKKKGKK